MIYFLVTTGFHLLHLYCNKHILTCPLFPLPWCPQPRWLYSLTSALNITLSGRPSLTSLSKTVSVSLTVPFLSFTAVFIQDLSPPGTPWLLSAFLVRLESVYKTAATSMLCAWLCFQCLEWCLVHIKHSINVFWTSELSPNRPSPLALTSDRNTSITLVSQAWSPQRLA